jgi:hypothetical protein
MTSPAESAERRAVLLTMATCLVVVVSAVVVALVFGSPEEPGKGKKATLTAAAEAEARCAAPTPDTLKDAGLAFQGRLVELDGDEAVFEVDHWYKGEEAEEVVIETESARLFGAPLVEETEYLVVGDGDAVRPCGTGEKTHELTMAYENAFSSD